MLKTKRENEREAICAVSVEPTWHFKEKQTTNMGKAENKYRPDAQFYGGKQHLCPKATSLHSV